MASMQESRREEHPQSAAQKAADELSESRSDRVDEAAPVGPRGGCGGILGSVQESARSVIGAVRGTATATEEGKTKDDAADKRAWGVMDAAMAAAEHARDLAIEKKEGARKALAGDAVARKGETDESAWQQGQDVRRRAVEKAEEVKHIEREPSVAEKGRSATENIYGKAKGAMGAFGEKMVMPTDAVEQKRAEAAGARGGWKTGAAPATGSGHEEHGRDAA